MDLMECPYDKTHIIVSARMPYHLMKCRKNFPTTDLVVCPFNAVHEVQKAELKYHMLNCPDRVLLEKEVSMKAVLVALEGSNPPFKKGCTDVPRTTDTFYDSDDENWDLDSNHTNFSRFSRHSDETHLRRPISQGLAAELSSSRAMQTPVSPQAAFLNDVSCMGPARARPTLPTCLGFGRGNSLQSNTSIIQVIRPGLSNAALMIGRGRSFVSTNKT